MQNRLERIDRVIEIGIYLYIVFMFLTKGEGIRNILIFGNFALWLFTLRYRRDLYLLKDPVSISFWTYIGITAILVPSSIDPLYSFMELRHEPLKSALLFPVIATVMTDEKRLKRIPYVCLFTAILIVLNAYYSYIVYDIPILKPNTPLMYVWHNKFARYLNLLLAFSFILYLLWKRHSLRLLLTLSFIISILALILSTSREGYLAFLTIASIWGLYLWKSRGHNFLKTISIVVLIFIALGILSIISFPDVRERIFLTVSHIKTLNERAEPWEPAFYAIMKRPITGWGYGKGIFYKTEPYSHIPYTKVPEKGPHNTYIDILFSQGVVGLISYVSLILVSIGRFLKEAFRSHGIRSYILIAGVSVIIGNYIINAIFTVLNLSHLAVVLGLCVASMRNNEDRDN
ncbi:MAG: O-antigen ligase RfaL [Thermodesulfovibrionia bacterium]